MRAIWVAGMAGLISAAVIARPDVADAILQQVYPVNTAQRLALDRCALENQNFDRLDAAARDACYRRSAAVQKAAAAAPNFVDQWRDAGVGHLPRNDIRAEQRGDLYLRAAAYGR